MPNYSPLNSNPIQSGSVATIETIDREFAGEKAMEYSANNGYTEGFSGIIHPVGEIVKAFVSETPEALFDLLNQIVRTELPIGREKKTGIDFKTENAKVQAANLVAASAERTRQGVAAAAAQRENQEDIRYGVAGMTAEQRAKKSGLLQVGVQAAEFIRNTYSRAFSALKERWKTRQEANKQSTPFQTAAGRINYFTQMNMAGERAGGQHALSAVG